MSEGEKKLIMANAFTEGLLKAQNDLGDKYQEALEESTKQRKTDLENELTAQIESMIHALSKIKILTEEIKQIELLEEKILAKD